MAILGVASLGLGAAGQAAGAAGQAGTDPAAGGKLEVLERPSERFARSIQVHRAEQRYRAAYDSAREQGLEPGRDLLADARVAPDRLAAAATQLRRQIEEAGGTPPGASAGFAPPEEYGVSTATLESIAACESGGDPTAVSADGTYRGKYQFDYSTWASMGGSGDPAAAPEAEQDMRAAMLYAQSGSSPWPICGS